MELQVKLVIHERPDVLLYDSVSNLANDDNSPMSQLSTLFRAYITLERTYNGHRSVHPLVKAFISPTLSQIWSTNLRSVQNPPPPRSSPPFRETGQSRPRTTPRPLLEIVLGMNDLIPSLMTRSYMISQEHQDLLNRVFAELCRCTALLEEVDGAYESTCFLAQTPIISLIVSPKRLASLPRTNSIARDRNNCSSCSTRSLASSTTKFVPVIPLT